MLKNTRSGRPKATAFCKREGFNLQEQFADIAIVGGGAAGLAAAISAARLLQKKTSPARIVILEQGARVGKKLLSTGNGRCNLTNTSLSGEAYHSFSSSFPLLFRDFSTEKVLSFFEQLGLLCRIEEGGRVYPYSGQASTVLDTLRQTCALLGIAECCEFPVTGIRFKKQDFLLSSEQKCCRCKAVIIACGGRAAAFLGIGKDGYTLLSSFGHSITPVFPSLVPVKSDPKLTRSLKGVRVSCSVTLLRDGTPLKTETGELQFTESGLSGICIFQLSRYAGEFQTLHTAGGKPCRALECSVDLFPEFSTDSFIRLLCTSKERQPGLSVGQLLCGLLHKRVAQSLLKTLNLSPELPAGQLNLHALKSIANRAKNWLFPVYGTLSWQNAQVTAGGVSLSEFDSLTLESKCIPGLFAAGEVLDVDGDCGGFNLHWAWSSGIRAGESAAERLMQI